MKRTLLLVLLAALALAGCYGAPTPEVDHAPVSGCEPVKLLLVGDSLMEQSGQAIIGRLHDAGYPVDAQVVAHGGSNVHEYSDFIKDGHPAGYTNPRQELQHYLDTFAPDIVVVDWGINPVVSFAWSGLGELMQAQIDFDMHDVKQMVSDADAELYWTTIPWRADTVDLAVWADQANTKIGELGVPLVDWRAATSDASGAFYADFLKYPEDDSVHPIRSSDGLHFETGGVERVAEWTAARLAPEACKVGS